MHVRRSCLWLFNSSIQSPEGKVFHLQHPLMQCNSNPWLAELKKTTLTTLRCRFIFVIQKKKKKYLSHITLNLIRPMFASPTMSPPADGSSFDQHALVVPVQMVLQVLLFLGLGAELQVYVVGELGEIAKALLSTAHTVPREAWEEHTCRTCMFTAGCVLESSALSTCNHLWWCHKCNKWQFSVF